MSEYLLKSNCLDFFNLKFYVVICNNFRIFRLLNLNQQCLITFRYCDVVDYLRSLPWDYHALKNVCIKTACYRLN